MDRSDILFSDLISIYMMKASGGRNAEICVTAATSILVSLHYLTRGYIYI